MSGGILVLITKVNKIFNFNCNAPADFNVTGDVPLDLWKPGIVFETPFPLPQHTYIT